MKNRSFLIVILAFVSLGTTAWWFFGTTKPPCETAFSTQTPSKPVKSMPRAPKINQSFSHEKNAEQEEYVIFGEDQQIRLEKNKLHLVSTWDDGTTQYDYDSGNMMVTILPSGEILLLPREI